MMPSQKCKDCGVLKPLDEFFNNSVKKNGKDSKCKECRKKASKKWRKDNEERIKEKNREKYEENREKILAKKAEYWEKNKETIRVRVAGWRQDNQEEIREKEKEYRDVLLEAVFSTLGYVCAECGETIREFLTVDHVNDDGNEERKLGSLGWKRKILSGEFNKEKYRVLCHNCNQARYRRNPVHHLSSAILIGTEKTCFRCNVRKDLSLFCSQNSNMKNVCKECRRKRTEQIRERCFELIGKTCKCCGESDVYKLTLDHVNDDGGEKRKRGERAGIDVYRKILNGSLRREEFQTLCWNCNHSKHRGKGMCFHQRSGISLMKGPLARKPKSVTTAQETVDFELSDVRVLRSKVSEEVRGFLDENHYAGFGRPSSKIVIARIKKQLVGVVKFAPPVRQGIAASVGVKSKELLELDRFCIHPAFHKKNFATFFMSRAVKEIKSQFPGVTKLVSFADPRFGHLGTIYKASNWEEVGKTSRGYYYENERGEEINKKTLYEYARKRRMTERQCFEALGLKRVHTPPKIKFVYSLV